MRKNPCCFLQAAIEAPVRYFAGAQAPDYGDW